MLEQLKRENQSIDEKHPRLSIRDFRAHLSDALSYATTQKDSIVLTKNGEERVGVVPLEYIWLIDELGKKINIDEMILHSKRNEGILWTELRTAFEKILSPQMTGDDDAEPPERSAT